jgi:hypothetical protein
MNMTCFLVCNNVTPCYGEFDLCVAIWSFQYVSPYSLIFRPKCEAIEDIFGFVLTKSDKKSSLACLSINTFVCRRGVILDGIVERRVFFCSFMCRIFFVFDSL